MSTVLYIGAGILVFSALWFLFRKTGVGLSGLFSVWFPHELTLLTLPLWPVTATLSLVVWVCGYFELRRKENDLKKREEWARKGTDKYAHMSMDELIAEQRRVMGAMEERK